MATPRRFSAAAVWAARSSSPARPATAAALPRPGASRVSPPATRTTSCGAAPWTARVDSRSAGSSVAITAVAVSSLVVDAGMPGRSGSRSSRCAPVAASRTVTPTEDPRPGSASAGARTVASAPRAGSGAAVPADGQGRPRCGLGGGDGHARRAVRGARRDAGRGPTEAGSAGAGVEGEDARHAVLDVEPDVAAGAEQEDEHDGDGAAHEPPLWWTGVGTGDWPRA